MKNIKFFPETFSLRKVVLSNLVIALCSFLLLGGCNTDRKAQALGEEGEPDVKEAKVLIIGIDGVRIDVLKQVSTPNIDELIREGVLFDKAQTRMPTVSGPGWSSMLTSVWSDKHGVKGNQFKNKNYEQYPDFLTRLEQIDPEFSTYSATTWPPLSDTLSGGPLVSDSVDIKQRFNGDDIGYPAADSQAIEISAKYISQQDPDAAFVYIGNPDVVAHRLGPLTEEYRQALVKADAYVGQLIQAIRNRPTYAGEDWLILISTDHGHVDEGGHGGSSKIEKNIFVLASGPSVRQEASEIPAYIVDVAVTAMNHLGISIKEGWNLDGHVVGISEN